MDKNDIQKRISEEEDYIKYPKMGNSLMRFVSKNPDGADDSTIARILMITEEEVKNLYEKAIKKLREILVDKYS